MQSSSLGREMAGSNLPGWQTAGIGLISGAMGPLSNAPIDTIKTRLQRMPAEEGQTAMQRIRIIAADMFKQEGPKAFYKVCVHECAQACVDDEVDGLLSMMLIEHETDC